MNFQLGTSISHIRIKRNQNIATMGLSNHKNLFCLPYFSMNIPFFTLHFCSKTKIMTIAYLKSSFQLLTFISNAQPSLLIEHKIVRECEFIKK